MYRAFYFIELILLMQMNLVQAHLETVADKHLCYWPTAMRARCAANGAK